MDVENILAKWEKAKKKTEILEKKIEKYKAEIAKEMNRKNVDHLSVGGYSVRRRRNTRTYLSKESVPSDIWKEYATKCSYDAFFLTRK